MPETGPKSPDRAPWVAGPELAAHTVTEERSSSPSIREAPAIVLRISILGFGLVPGSLRSRAAAITLAPRGGYGPGKGYGM